MFTNLSFIIFGFAECWRLEDHARVSRATPEPQVKGWWPFQPYTHELYQSLPSLGLPVTASFFPHSLSWRVKTSWQLSALHYVRVNFFVDEIYIVIPEDVELLINFTVDKRLV